MPRRPALFEAKTKQHRYKDEEWELSSAVNYMSAKELKAGLKEQFLEEERTGAMIRMSRSQAEQKYGLQLLVAASGAIEKTRVIHDGTNTVRLNPQIQVRDPLRNPTARELKVLNQRAHRRGATLCLTADVKRAHHYPL